jgi:hypothetical protein
MPNTPATWSKPSGFCRSKPRLPEGELLAIAVSPLADAYFPPDTVHFYVDNMQAYHLASDYMAAMDVHPLRPSITMNSSACGGNVYTHLQQTFNMVPACSGSYNAGKTERGEVNVMIPWGLTLARWSGGYAVAAGGHGRRFRDPTGRSLPRGRCLQKLSSDCLQEEPCQKSFNALNRRRYSHVE